MLNDLWHYNVSTNQWTWVSGDNTGNQAGVYGTKGVSNPANKPAGKMGGVAWMDNTGYIWVFGGYGKYGNSSGYSNDLFRFVPDPACVPVSGVFTISSNITICNGQSVTLTALGGTNYSWSPGGQSASSVVVGPTASTTYTVTGNNVCGFNTSTVRITVNSLPTASINGIDTICTGDNVMLTAGGGDNYSWNTGQTNLSITINPTVSAIYTATVSIWDCSALATFTLTVEPAPTVTAWNDVTITQGQSATLTATGGGTYSWSPATGLNHNSATILRNM